MKYVIAFLVLSQFALAQDSQDILDEISEAVERAIVQSGTVKVDGCKMVEINLTRNSLKQLIFWEQRFKKLELTRAVSEMWFCNYTRVTNFPYLVCRDYRVFQCDDDVIVEYVGEGKHQVIWKEANGGYCKVYCYHVIVTETKHDPEIENRKKLPERFRNKLFVSPKSE